MGNTVRLCGLDRTCTPVQRHSHLGNVHEAIALAKTQEHPVLSIVGKVEVCKCIYAVQALAGLRELQALCWAASERAECHMCMMQV